MSRERGFLSIYFKDEGVLKDLDQVMKERLPGQSVSSFVCGVMGQVLDQIKSAPAKRKTLKATVLIKLD